MNSNFCTAIKANFWMFNCRPAGLWIRKLATKLPPESDLSEANHLGKGTAEFLFCRGVPLLLICLLKRPLALKFFNMCRDSSMLSANNLVLSKGRALMVFWTSFGNPDSGSQEALLITTAIEIKWVAVSVMLREAYRDVLASSWPSTISAWTCSLCSAGRCSIN